jgi:hypothetical protein
MATGRRSEIVRNVGLSSISFFRFPLDQSTYFVESAVSQNFRSSASLLNLGISFMDAIDLCFIPVHVPDRNNADQITTNCKGCKEQPSRGRLSQRVIKVFASPMPHVTAHHQRFLKKYFFRFLGRDTMPLPVLLDVGFVPLKSYARLQRISSRHTSVYCYHIPSYALGDCRSRGQFRLCTLNQTL